MPSDFVSTITQVLYEAKLQQIILMYIMYKRQVIHTLHTSRRLSAGRSFLRQH